MLSKLVRIGRDAELRYTANNKSVLSFAAVYDVGFGENKKPQWLDCSMWGARAESLAEHFTKGKQIVIYADDLHIETYPKNDNTQGVKLKCKVVDFDFASDGGQSNRQPQRQQQQAPQQAPSYSGQQAPPQHYQQQAAPQQAPQQSAEAFDDDIPF